MSRHKDTLDQLDEFADYGAVPQRFTELKTELNQAERVLSEMLGNRATRRPNAIEVAALQLVGGGGTDTGAAWPLVDEVSDNDIASAQHTVHALRRAVDLYRQTEGKARQAAAREYMIQPHVKQELAELSERLVGAVTELTNANGAFDAFTAKLDALRIPWTGCTGTRRFPLQTWRESAKSSGGPVAYILSVDGGRAMLEKIAKQENFELPSINTKKAATRREVQAGHVAEPAEQRRALVDTTATVPCLVGKKATRREVKAGRVAEPAGDQWSS